MCGIFGIITNQESKLTQASLKKLTNRLFHLSETRGKEASGLTLLTSTDSEQLFVMRSPSSASKLVNSTKYNEVFEEAFAANGSQMSGVAFGHTRLVTNGTQLSEENNQPVVSNGAVGIHNGIIVNVDSLWESHSDLTRETDVDTEVLLALIRKYYGETNSPVKSIHSAFKEIRGTASIAVTFTDANIMILATNHGSLYLASSPSKEKPLFFASESFTLNKFLASKLGIDFSDYTIKQIEANNGLIIDLDTLHQNYFDIITPENEDQIPANRPARDVKTYNIGESTGHHSVFEIKKVSVPAQFIEDFERVEKSVATLQRCTKCVLPETVPFIEFNSEGVCNFCTNYKKIDLMGRDALEAALKPYRKPGRQPDVVAAMSGGRDSCYGLHYMVKELGLKPVAYTYDWGMVTDIARRNIARMCGALGIEHILLSANIPWKRENIRKNVEAWLKKPHLGMIPLFMAGDKQFVWYGNRVKKQTGLELDIFTFNLMEKTQFKEEYTGIQFWKPGEDSDKLGEELGIWRGVKLCQFYGTQFLTNPGYWNNSLLDTFYGFVTYYVMPRKFEALFRYVEWKEDEVNDTLINQYDWEVADDASTTWRIGDGTAPFYNYIYYMVGGFTEHDTLRSNQIREGHISREEALSLVTIDNKPRWDSFKWYCDVVNLDFERTVRTINRIPKTNTKLEE